MRVIPPSELITNSDGSIFHLHLRADQLADIIILVGDRGRVEQVASHFESRECEVQNREFKTITGLYGGVRMSVISTGIGIGNIDIVLNEVDALANVDLESRTPRKEPRSLTLLRLGTSGALQSDIMIGDMIFASTAVGFDGVLNFYKGSNEICNKPLTDALAKHLGWSSDLPPLYGVDADETLRKLFEGVCKEGITVASPGFYAPQGRQIRVPVAYEQINDRLESFRYNSQRVTNFEMESSLLGGLAKLMGHRGATLCTIIAQRVAQEMQSDYKPYIDRMIKVALDRLQQL